MTVPMTVSLVRTTLMIPVDTSPAGIGTKDKRNRKRPTGHAVRNRRVKVGRCRLCKPANRESNNRRCTW